MPDLKNLTMEEIEFLKNKSQAGVQHIDPRCSIADKAREQFPDDKIKEGDMLILFAHDKKFVRAGIACVKSGDIWKSSIGDLLSGHFYYTFKAQDGHWVDVDNEKETPMFTVFTDFEACKQYCELVRGEL